MFHCLRFRNSGGLALLCTLLGTLCETGCGQIRYLVPEELEKGSFVGSIARDLGLEPQELAERGVRIVSRGRMQLFSLNPRSGSLVTADRIDREELCAQSARCTVKFNVLVEDKLKIFEVEVEIKDINDNAPNFLTEELEVKISELTVPGTRFPLKTAFDPDVGMNSLQNYKLSPSEHFSLAVNSVSDGATYPELVLERALDREKKEVHQLDLIASDGGDPIHSGNLCIHVIVLDANDNPPVFTQPEYHVSVQENVPVGTQLVTVNATDPDEGFNAQVTYILDKMPGKIAQIFDLNSVTGDVSLLKSLDYEDSMFYEIKIEAQDGPGLLSRAKILVTVLDVNDNAPEVTVTSLTGLVPEEATAGREIALINVHDRDSGQNGQVTVSVLGNLPFNLERSIDQYYRLVTAGALDREQMSVYNITLRATDGGNPPLSTETHIILLVADINDNPPAFSDASYTAYIPENNPRGASIFSVTAQDPDSDSNAQITYSLTEDIHQGAPLSSYITINSNTGVLYALRSFDYEEFRDLKLLVTASDSGNPPLSSNVSLNLFVLDQNDNMPEILYPTVPTDGSSGVELAPRSAEPGYLVTKVVAVDRDSGQNAWLSYHLLKASEPGLFSVGLHTGEVRTARALMDRDALKQSLLIAVQDHGQPPFSATVTLTIAVADRIPDVLADLGSTGTPTDPDDSDLTLYLVVAVAAVSCVFLAFVIVLAALRLRHWQGTRVLQAASSGLAGAAASHFVGVDGVHAFLQAYSHEVSLTADSRKSHFIFPQPNYADTLISQESCEKSEPLLVSQDMLETKQDPKLLEQQVLSALSQIAKHSVDLAEMVVEAEIFPVVLTCLKDKDEYVKKNACTLIREIAKHTPELSQLIVNTGGVAAVTDCIGTCKGNTRLPGIMMLGYVAAHSENLAMAVIISKGVPQLSICLSEEPEDHIKAAAAWALGQIGRHTSEHARAVAVTNTLPVLLSLYMSTERSEDLQMKCKKAIKSILQKCTYLPALEPFLYDAPPNILKHVLGQFSKVLPHDSEARRLFVTSGGLRKVQEIQAEPGSLLQDYINSINNCYPEEVVRYYSPGYSDTLLQRVDNYQPVID